MQISFEKFLKITALLASGVGVASGCHVEVVDDAAGGQGNGSGGTSGNTQSGGTSASNAGVASGGRPTSEGGAFGGTAASAGAAGQNLGGASDASGAGGLNGGVVAGADNAGGAAGADACVSGAPAQEGGGFDCSTLPYATDTCPNPSGEGSRVPVPGAELCERYAGERAGSVSLLTDCLGAITKATDQCAPVGAAQALSCETAMLAGTCAAPVAVTACAAIHSACAEVTQAQCVLDLSPLAETRVADVRDCVETSTSTQCAYTYRECRGLPTQALAVTDACGEVLGVCPQVSRSTCEDRLDIYGTGKILDVTYYYYRDCMKKSVATPCASAFDTCTQ